MSELERKSKRERQVLIETMYKVRFSVKRKTGPTMYVCVYTCVCECTRRNKQELVSMYTHPHKANELLIADGLVGLVDGGRTVGRPAVAEARVPTAVVVPALVAESQPAVSRAARTL